MIKAVISVRFSVPNKELKELNNDSKHTPSTYKYWPFSDAIIYK
ncbi:MAG: hypothetical protein ACI80L_002721 [Pseudohongiellaceae bacterium]